MRGEKEEDPQGAGGKPVVRDITKRSYQFAGEIVRLCQKLDDRPSVWRVLGKQLLRSGTSIGANIEEAQAGQSRADFINKYAISLKEARETHYWLRLLRETDSKSVQGIDILLKEADEIGRIIGSIILKARNQL